MKILGRERTGDPATVTMPRRTGTDAITAATFQTTEARIAFLLGPEARSLWRAALPVVHAEEQGGNS
jgi:hypothetical protein